MPLIGEGLSVGALRRVAGSGGLRGALLFPLALSGGCSSESELTADEMYSQNVQPILENNCTESCHEPDGYMPDLVFGPGVEADVLVNAPSIQVPTMDLVEPGNLDESYLWHKLMGTHLEVGGEGDMMPYDDLTQAELDGIRDYILAL